MVQIVKEHATKPGIPWDPAIERRELNPAKCPLASYLCTVACTQTCTYTINNCKKFFKRLVGQQAPKILCLFPNGKWVKKLKSNLNLQILSLSVTGGGSSMLYSGQIAVSLLGHRLLKGTTVSSIHGITSTRLHNGFTDSVSISEYSWEGLK